MQREAHLEGVFGEDTEVPAGAQNNIIYLRWRRAKVKYEEHEKWAV